MAAEYNLRFSGATLKLACANPYMYPLVNSNFVKDATLRKLPVKNYIIFYRPDDTLQELQVIRALYGIRYFKDIL